MANILSKKFYARNTLVVAKELLGKYIVRKIGKKKLAGKIVEVEAYHGLKDLASHASRGKTARNAMMFGHAGHAYVYMIYGMYYCFNIVTGDHGYPAAVLIRAVEPLFPPLAKERVDFSELSRTRVRPVATNGPGKFCRAFKIDKSLNGVDVTKKGILWIEERDEKINPALFNRCICKAISTAVKKCGVKKADIIAAKRIGVDYAKEYKDKLWRFYIKGNE